MSETAQMLMSLFIIFVSAKVAGAIFARFRQPAVVAEILVGIALGPTLLGIIHGSEFLNLFAELGVVFLLFIVGLECDPMELLRVGRQSAAVAVLGVVAPFALGYFLMKAFGRPVNESLFVGTALTATSVGITARALEELGHLRTTIARVILGAAVFDDVMGILILAVISGVATEMGVSSVQIVVLTVEAVAFCGLSLLLGRPVVHRLTPYLSRHEEKVQESMLFALAVALCLGFSFLASFMKLAAIIGAFFAGALFAETREAEQLRRHMGPLYGLVVPIFFVMMGTHVEFRGMTTEVLVIGLLITLVAVIGKLVGCGLGALSLGRRAALTVGIGMVPRGEVGLVVASLGLARGVIGQDVYSMVVLMCVVTSVFPPALLRGLLRQRPEEEGPAAEEGSAESEGERRRAGVGEAERD